MGEAMAQQQPGVLPQSTAKHAAIISRRFRLVGSLAGTNSGRARRRLGLAPAILLIHGRPFVPGFVIYSFLFFCFGRTGQRVVGSPSPLTTAIGYS